MEISDFLNTKYKNYAYYVINNRAIPSIKDGFKPVQRRILWTGISSAQKFVKISAFAGACLKIHPHGDASISQSIGNMTQRFSGANNIPYLDGKGGFGCKILGPGKGIGAARYVSVKLSKFTKENIFFDMELVKEIPNYDGEHVECENFLPIIPVVLINGISGIAVGFATEILSYKLSDIVKVQIDFLTTGKTDTVRIKPFYDGFKGSITWNKSEEKFFSAGRWSQEGNKLTVTELPIGMYREQFIKLLDKLEDKGSIREYEDNSKAEYDFTIILPRGVNITDNDMFTIFKLKSALNENLTLLDTNNKLKVYDNVIDIIKEFTDWRFSFIKKRYEKRLTELKVKNIELENLSAFIKFVIKTDYLKTMTKLSRVQIKRNLKDKFVQIDSLLSKPVAIFTKDQIDKLRIQIKNNLTLAKEFDIIINNEKKQIAIFKKELKEIV